MCLEFHSCSTLYLVVCPLWRCINNPIKALSTIKRAMDEKQTAKMGSWLPSNLEVDARGLRSSGAEKCVNIRLQAFSDLPFRKSLIPVGYIRRL